MANKNFSRFDRVSAKVKGEATESTNDKATEPPKGQGRASAATHLFSTDRALKNLSSTAKRKEVVLYQVPPARVRLWEEHNRRYDLLDDKRCADLIDSFKRTGRQEFAAVVRPVNDDPQHDYELICGARRHWTTSYLGWDLLVEVRALDDRQAFTLQDIENRDREDISDYERAVDYKNALPKYFDNNRASMSKFLEIDRGNLSRLLDLADLPPPLVDVYHDVRELKVHHGSVYKKLLSGDPKVKRRVIERAKQISKDNLPGKRILTELKRAALVPVTPSTPKPVEIKIAGLKKPILVTTDATGTVVKLPPLAQHQHDAAIAAISNIIQGLER